MKSKEFPRYHFWTTEAGLTGLLMFLFLFLMASFLLDKYYFAKILSLLFVSMFFISGALSVAYRPTARLVFGGIALVALVCIWTDYFLPEVGLRTWRLLAGIVALGYLIVLLLHHVFHKGAITYHKNLRSHRHLSAPGLDVD